MGRRGSQDQFCIGGINEPTCNINSDCKANRRDFVLINDILHDAAKGYRVSKEDVFPTHRPIQVSLDLAKLRTENRTLRKPTSAAEAFEERVERITKETKESKGEANENEVRKAEKTALHKAIDEQLEQREGRMTEAILQGQAEKLWASSRHLLRTVSSRT